MACHSGMPIPQVLRATTLEKSVFDHKKWLKEFNSSRNRKQLRMEIMHQTLEVCKNFKYALEDGTEVAFSDRNSVSKDAQKTVLHKEVSPPKRKVKDDVFETTITVVNADCLEVAIQLKSEGFNPAVLNMASSRRPGGGYLSGAGAQEENLFRRTNYVQHLADPDKEFDPERKWTYRLPEFSCVYSTNVFIIRASEAEGYAFLPHPVSMSFLALSAYCSPPLTCNKQKLNPEVADKTKQKMRCMFATGLYYGHDSLVLSALGCGAFRNPPRHVAQLFKEVLTEKEFVNRYKVISFAIIDDHNAKGIGNYQPFFDVFSLTSS
ncbi:uncharacterized protein [Montipora capricornis]|uniref:uncharacterized protein n=1 Tax=Montipora capricornis TaxID=246305 RepID=UPI0035F1B7E2